MKPLRSLLYVPGHREDWPEKAVTSGADALILDLEDAVPVEMKDKARHAVARSVARLRAAGVSTALYVRLNALDTGLSGDDIETVAVPGVDGFLLPKVYRRDDIVRYDALVEHYERRNGVEPGSIEFLPVLETAEAHFWCDELATAPRVASLIAGAGKGGDFSRAIGFEWTPEGMETLYLRSKVVLAMRSHGLARPLVGIWQDINDRDGLRTFCRQNRQLGIYGLACIHPSQVAVANEVFEASEEEIAYYEGLIVAFEAANANGQAAAEYRGQLIDYAHAKTARQALESARKITRV